MIHLWIGGRHLELADNHVRRYCGLSWSGGSPETWAYHYYDAVPASLDNVVSASDVLAAGALHNGLARRDLAFFRERSDDVSTWLGHVDPCQRLEHTDEDDIAHLTSLVHFEPEVSLSLLSKVLHRKRPLLIPLLDRAVINWYRRLTRKRVASEAWLPFLRALREDLCDEGNRSAVAMLRQQMGAELRGPLPSAIRIIDISIWMASR